MSKPFSEPILVILRSITLRNFRSYKTQNLSFHNKFNLIYGNNAQGKTNLLEAIYFLCNFRPFKQLKNEELITFGESSGGIKGEIDSETGLDEIHIYISKGEKTVRLNGKIVYSLSKYAGRFNVVLYLPEDLRIIKGSPGVRRQYIDAFICSLRNEHIKDLKDYNKAITHRNAVLYKSSNVDKFSLEIWDEKIAEIGARIIKRRIKAIERLSKELNPIYNSTSGVNSIINIKYRASFKHDGTIEDSIRSSLRSNIPKDRLRGHTSVGPHRDIITIQLDGKDTSSYASQGESKNLVLALKASEIKLYDSKKGEKPILLLDDITSELDKNRKGFLFELLRDYAGQVFVTSTGVDEIPYRGKMKSFHIKAGKALQTK